MSNETSSQAADDRSPHTLIHGNGQMAELIRHHDWSSTPLGRVELWPESLLCSVNLMLACAFPSLVFWDGDMVQLYNDAFRPLLAERHSSGLGQTAQECWSDAWHIVGPNLKRVMVGRETVYYENALVPIVRDGRIQDIRWTYNYSPIFGSNGVVLGVLVICQDLTREVTAVQGLRDSEARAARVLQSIGDAVIETDADTRVVRMNPVAERLTGWTAETAKGELLADVFQIVNESTRQPVQSPADRTTLHAGRKHVDGDGIWWQTKPTLSRHG
jgi:PAS domain S-box-containing protein